LVPVLQARDNPVGRVYAAYGAVFIALSLLWGAVVAPTRATASAPRSACSAPPS
jgi:drug/metabolite transporter superfamily protein YnfA